MAFNILALCCAVELLVMMSASKLSALLDSLPLVAKPSAETKNLSQLESHAATAADPVTESLLSQELQAYISRKVQLRARLGAAAGNREGSDRLDVVIALQQGHGQKQEQPHDTALLETLTSIIVDASGVWRWDASTPTLAMDQVEQIVAHYEAHRAKLRQITLQRKACHAELSQLMQRRAGRLSSSATWTSTGDGVGLGSDWDDCETEFQALAVATDRLQRNVLSQVQHIEAYADTAIKDVLPPLIG